MIEKIGAFGSTDGNLVRLVGYGGQAPGHVTNMYDFNQWETFSANEFSYITI